MALAVIHYRRSRLLNFSTLSVIGVVSKIRHGASHVPGVTYNVVKTNSPIGAKVSDMSKFKEICLCV